MCVDEIISIKVLRFFGVGIEQTPPLWYNFIQFLMTNRLRDFKGRDMAKDNFGFEHKSGILMAVSSLPSKYGIGTFGAPCRRFVDFLRATGTKCWQILPLNPTAYGDSPYQSPSSFAGNPYFIDLEALKKKGLLKEQELKGAMHDSVGVDYGWLWQTRFEVLKRAYERFEKDDKFALFCEKNASWLDDYAYFTALKVAFGHKAWIEWDEEYRFYARALAHRSEHAQEIDFWKFVQYIFFTQWAEVRAYASKMGVVIVGDMPIYVAYDSVDVWSNPDQFLLDEDLNPVIVAGCPPDGFAPDGQLWGNPIYDYQKMEKDGFSWWVSRVKQAFCLYDILRIDHFRGFAGYFAVKYGEKTARDGEWQKGPDKALFSVINDKVHEAKIIAEDLGFITQDVRELLDFCGYPGMKVLQFAFDNDDSEYLPRKFKDENCIVYTGSHDSPCTASWCKALCGDTLARFKKECLRISGGANRTYAMINFAFKSKANLAVVPLQDWMLLPSEQARMNTPSVAEGNWTWRAPMDYDNPQLILRIRKTNERFARTN